MDDQVESREEWEKEIRDIQGGYGFERGQRAAQIIAKKMTATPAPIADFKHLVMLALSGVLLCVAFVVFSSDLQHKTVLSAASVAGALCFGINAFRQPRS